MIPDNACTLRITAAAGTELAGAYSFSTVKVGRNPPVLPKQKPFTTRRAVFRHAAWLRQSFLHCARFLTAASRRRLGRVSVPVWGLFLYAPLSITCCVRFSSIAQDSSLLPPVGVWAVSQSQCGGSSSQTP